MLPDEQYGADGSALTCGMYICPSALMIWYYNTMYIYVYTGTSLSLSILCMLAKF